MIKTILEVDGMMCGMCEAHVNDSVRAAFPAVKKVTSSRAKKQTEILSEEPLDEQKLKDAISATGYIPGKMTASEAKKGFHLFGR